MIIADIIKVVLPAVVSFIVGIILTPFVTKFLYSHKMWKKKSGKVAMDGKPTPIFNELHKDKEVNTPRMGGVIIWLSAFITILGISFFSRLFASDLSTKLEKCIY